MAEPKRYLIRLWDLDKPLSDLHPTYPMVHYYEYHDMKERADALDTEVKAMWAENRELRHKIQMLTPPLWLRVLAWLVSFVGAFWLAHLVLNWMNR